MPTKLARCFLGQVNRYHWGFDDPAQAKGSEEEIYAEFRRVRDQIRQVFEAYAAGLREGANRNAPVEPAAPQLRSDLALNSAVTKGLTHEY